MKNILFFTAILFLESCGQGVPQMSHSGMCDGYTSWQNSTYVLPWATATSHRVTQGNCGSASHLGVQRYAYDFQMNIGTSIVAARTGTVIELEEKNTDGSGCNGLNFVRIRHSDNSIGTYLHLTKDGVLVNVGDVVSQGSAIALSGNTGCSSNPHLHFAVYTSDSSDTIPVTFSNTTQNARGLQAGSEYTAQ